jgi:hypothetical protein
VNANNPDQVMSRKIRKLRPFIATYVRTSAGEGRPSTATQFQAIRAYAKRQGIRIVMPYGDGDINAIFRD